MQADEIDFSCDQSIRSFAEDGLLRGHREAHAGERKSSCNQCGRPCLEQDSLEKYMRMHVEVGKHKIIHAEEKQLACDRCTKSFLKKRV